MARILITDDDPVQRRFVTKELSELGHECLHAEDGGQALEILRTERIDLILLDMHMDPGMGGAETFEHLRKSPVLREIPVLILSGSESDQVVEFIARGAEDYLMKSFEDRDRALLRARVTNCLQKKLLRDEREKDLRQLRVEQQKVNWLLSSLFPFDVVNQLLQALDEDHDTPQIAINARSYRQAAVMFCDIVNFTAYCEEHDPRVVVGNLQAMVTAFERIANQHRLEKIKTIGDSFMATAGMRDYLPNSVKAAVECGREMLRVAQATPPHWSLRIGIDFGPVVGGIVGNEKFQYDIWGRTVNMAARVESEGRDGCINLSQTAWKQVVDVYQAELHPVTLKGLGEQMIYVIEP